MCPPNINIIPWAEGTKDRIFQTDRSTSWQMTFKRISEEMYYTFRGLNDWAMFSAQHNFKKWSSTQKFMTLNSQYYTSNDKTKRSYKKQIMDSFFSIATYKNLEIHRNTYTFLRQSNNVGTLVMHFWCRSWAFENMKSVKNEFFFRFTD